MWGVSRARVPYFVGQRGRAGMEGLTEVQQGHKCSVVVVWGLVAFLESAPLQIFAQIETNYATGIL